MGGSALWPMLRDPPHLAQVPPPNPRISSKSCNPSSARVLAIDSSLGSSWCILTQMYSNTKPCPGFRSSSQRVSRNPSRAPGTFLHSTHFSCCRGLTDLQACSRPPWGFCFIFVLRMCLTIYSPGLAVLVLTKHAVLGRHACPQPPEVWD